MSAELLRRAADLLRKHALALPGTMTGSWSTRSDRVIADDGTDVGMLVVEPYNPADDKSLMEHIALTASPPLAAALAAWLDYEACDAELDLGSIGGRELAYAVAQRILREPS